MGQSIRDKILDLFFENPIMNFQIRGIARELNLSKSTVSYHINKLLEQKLIRKQRKGVFPSYRANETGEMYKFFKSHAALKKVIESGLINYLDSEFNPRCIILFGSFAKAEYDKNSDIDIFLQSKESEADLIKFEKKIGHEIQLFFESNPDKLPPALFNNIINGIKLMGFFKIK